MGALKAVNDERQRGFALLIVLWTLVLISFLVAQLTGNGRSELTIASNLVSNAVAQAAADGATYEAIFNLIDQQPERHWQPDGSPHEIRIGTSRISLRVKNEAGRVNPNLAPPDLVEAMLRVVGAEPQRASMAATWIARWVGLPTASRPAIDQAMAGPAFHAPGSPLESIDELAQVPGIDKTLLDALRPHLTLLGPALPEPAAADPVVAAAMALMKPVEATRPLEASSTETVRIVAVADGPNGAAANRTAVIRIDPELPKGYAVLDWVEGEH